MDNRDRRIIGIALGFIIQGVFAILMMSGAPQNMIEKYQNTMREAINPMLDNWGKE